MSIAPSAASTVATTSGSRTEPPGWTNAETPATRQTSTASANGKNASDAQADPTQHAVRPVLECLGDRAAGGIHARRLAGAHPDQPPVADQHDRVGRDATDQPPGKIEVAAFGVGRLTPGCDGPGGGIVRGRVRGRDEDGAACARMDPVGSGGAPVGSLASAGSTSSRRLGFEASVWPAPRHRTRAPRRLRGRSRPARRRRGRRPVGSGPPPRRTPRPGRRPGLPSTRRGATVALPRRTGWCA